MDYLLHPSGEAGILTGDANITVCGQRSAAQTPLLA
jgi:hypothetical protein